VLTIAPHGGRIEPGTSEIAALIAGESYNLHRFEGRKPPGQNAVLHITSHHFDEPRALNLARKCRIVLGIHGCRGGSFASAAARRACAADHPESISIASLRQSTRFRAEIH
jgi:phage replication-related protein YjqB (UPF0714/DUF867 family)